MTDVGLPIGDVTQLDVFADAELHEVSPEARVHAVEALDDRAALRDSSGVVVAEIVSSAGGPSAPGLPWIELNPARSPVEAYVAITAELNDRMRYVAERSHAILRALNEAELQGRTLGDIVALLGLLVDHPVMLKDANHRVLAWSGEPSVFDPARQRTIAHGSVTSEVLEILASRGILDRIRNESAPFRVERDDRVGLAPRIICPVRAGDVHFGYLSISEGSRQLDDLDILAVESGASVAAFHLSRERAVQESTRSKRTLLLYELLYAPQGSVTRGRRQAALLDFDIDQDFSAISIQFDESLSAQDDPDHWQRLLSAVVATTETTLDRMGVKSTIAMAEDDGVLIIIPSHDHDLDSVIAAMLGDINAHQHVPPLSVGLSLPRQASTGLGASYEEARTAARLGRLMSGSSSITHYEELGVLRLLNEVSQDVLERHLEATLTDDQAFRDQFFETFGAYANSGYNKAAAARQLYIHVNTLKYRLGRIRAVTGHDPGEHHGRFALECTLRLLELQRARG